MSYSPFDYRIFPIFVYYFCVFIFGGIITIKMYKKWRERNVPPTLFLTLVFFFLTSSLVVLTIGLAEAVILGEFREIYRISLPLAYSLVIFADVFLFIFAGHITMKGKKAFPVIITIGIVIIVILFLPWNWWGIPSVDYEGKFNIRLYSTVSFVIYSLLIYGYIALICQKVKIGVEDRVMYTGLTLLFYSMISLILLFLMLIADTLLITLFNHPGYSDFIYLAWVFGLIFIILSYMSLVMPDWLIGWIKKKHGV